MLDQNDINKIGELIGASQKETNERFERIDVRFDQAQKETNERFERIDVRFDQAQKETNDQFAVVHNELGFVKQELRTFTHHFDERIDTLTAHVDSFIKLHKDLYQELTMFRSRFERLEETVQRIHVRIA